MITVTFPDGSVRQFPDGTTEAEVLAAQSSPPQDRPSLLRQFGEQVASAVGVAVPNTLSFLAPQLFDEYARGMQEWYRPTPVPNPSLLERGLQVAGSAIGSLVPTVAAIPLGVPGAIAATFLPTAGQERLEAVDQGASPLRAYAQGAISGGVEALSERFGGIGKITGPGRLANLTAKDFVKEPVSEMLSQAGQDLSAAYLTGTDPSRGLSKEFLGRQAEAAFGGLVGAGVMGPVQSISRRQLRSQLTEQAEDLQTKLNQNPGDATLIGQLAQTHAGLAQLVDETPSAPATPAERLNVVRKVGFTADEVQFNDAPKWDFTPLAETDKGLLTGYGIEIGRDGTKALLSAEPAPEVLPKLQQALVLAGFTSADKGVDLTGVRPTRIVAEADLGTGKVTLHGSNLSPEKLEQELREERAHMLLNRTELGKKLLDDFHRDRPLTPQEQADLKLYDQRQGESGGEYSRRLADEFIAKLNRDTSWWRPRVQELVARVKDFLGMQLTNPQAGRLLLRNLRRGTGSDMAVAGVRESRAPISLEESPGDGGVRRFKIRRGTTTVGSARVLGDTLGDIEILGKYQKQGLGTEAVQKLQTEVGVRNAIAGSEAGAALFRKVGWVPVAGNRFEVPAPHQSKIESAALRLPDGKVLTGRSLVQLQDQVPIGVAAEEGVVDSRGEFRVRESKVTPEQDAAYLDAVSRGDMATAEKMVEEAARAAGYTIGPVFHGTKGRLKGEFPFTVFRTDVLGKLSQEAGEDRPGSFFSANEKYAKGVALYQTGINRDGWAVVGRFFLRPDVGRYDRGAEGFKEVEYLATSPEQIKSAEPVTKDDAGNVIPLSKRFNPETPDIRESKAEDADVVAKNLFGLPYASLFPGQRADVDARVAKAASWMPRGDDRGVTRSEEFKAWFGNWEDPKAFSSRRVGPPVSVVVGRDRAPLRVYHSTRGDFNTFESGRPTFNNYGFLGNAETTRAAMFFTDSPSQAEGYSKTDGKFEDGSQTLPVFLRIVSPIRFDDSGLDYESLAAELGQSYRFLRNSKPWELFDGDEGKAFVAAAKKAGYDGAVFNEDVLESEAVPGTTYAVFDANQIKSATGNRGTFDATSNDIRESKAPAEDHDLNQILYREFPNAKVTLGDNVPGTVTVNPQGNVIVDRTVGKRELRSWVLLGLAEAGVLKLPTDFVEREIAPVVKALDPTAGNVRVYLKTRIRPYVQRGIAQKLLDWFRVRLPTAHSRALRAFYRLLDTFVADPTIQVKYDARDQLQVFLDQNGDELNDTVAKVQELKDLASYRDRLKYWRDRRTELQDRLTVIRDRVVAREPNLSGANVPEITDPNFLSGIGNESEDDRRTHDEFLQMTEAERVARLTDLRDDLRERSRFLANEAEGSPGKVEALDRLFEQLTKVSERLAKAGPNPLADQYRHMASDETQKAAEAAQKALDEPIYMGPITELHARAREKVVVTETSDGKGGVVVTETGAMTADPTRVPQSTRDAAKTDWLARKAMLRDTMEELEVSLGEKLKEKLAKAKAALKSRKLSELDASLAVQDILATVAGDLERSGSTDSRKTAERIREVSAQAAIFAERLAKVHPDMEVHELIDRAEFVRTRVDAATENGTEIASPRLAEQLGLSRDVLQEIVDLLQKSKPFMVAVVKLHDAARNKGSAQALATIAQLETGQETDIATALRRFRNLGKRLSREITGIEAELADLEVEYLRLQQLQNLFPYPSSPLQAQIMADLKAGKDVTELRNRRDEADPQTAVARMAYPTKQKGWMFKGILGEPDLEVNPANLFTTATMKKVQAWKEVASGSLDRVPPHVRRGLEVGVRLADNFLNEFRTTEQYLNQLRPTPLLDWLTRSKFGFKQLFPTLLPGIWSTRLGQSIQKRSDAQNRRNAVEARFIEPMHRAIQRAMDSLGLKTTSLSDIQTFRKIRTELSARLRKHGSGVEVGQALWSSKDHRVTLELLSLIRLDHKLGTEAAAAEAARDGYAGIQLNYSRVSPLTGKAVTQQLVRPRGETGDVGLARLADPELYRKLAAVKRAGDEAELKAWWASEEAAGGLAAHFQDADRNDTLIKRKPEVRKKEIALANQINTGKLHPSQFRTVADWARAAGITEAELMEELDQYAAIAEDRLGKGSTDTPSGMVQTFASTDDKTEFTMPAAKMAFPSSWYSFGSSDGLKAFLNRTADAANVEFLQELANAQEYLEQAATRIRTGTETSIPDLQWVLGSKKTKFSDKERGKAAETLKVRANFFRSQVALASAVLPSDQNIVLRGLHRFGIAPMLATYAGWVQNVVGTGTSMYLTLYPVLGPIGAALVTPFGMGAAVLHAAAEISLDAMRNVMPETTGAIEEKLFPNRNPEESVPAFLEAEGIGASYPRQFEAERAAVERGELPGNRFGVGWDEAVRALSRAQGTIRGDRQNNQFALRFLVPLVVLRFKQLALSGGTLTPEQREFLDTLGFGSAELALKALETTPIFRPWKTEIGAAIARRAVADFNATTFANRPSLGAYGSLLGWAAYTSVYAMSTIMRRTPNETVLKHLKPFIALTTAALLTNLARQGGLEASKEVAAQTAERLAAFLHDDRDDEDSWWEMLLATLGVYRALHAFAGVNTGSPTLKPTDQAYWDRPPIKVAVDLMSNIPQGLGINSFSIPTIEISKASLAGIVQTARGISDTGETDIKAGIRRTLGVGGMYGRLFGEMLLPGGRAGFESQAEIIAAANATGVKVEPFKGTAPFIPATPFRRELMAIGERMVAGDPTASADLESVKKAIETRAYNREIELGHSEKDAKKAAEAAVKSAVVSMDPYRAALGRSLDPEELDKLRSKVGPAVGRAEAARDAVVKSLGLRPTRGMRSPLRRGRGRSRLVLRAPARVRLR